jgi:hypothetical protein
LRPRIFTFRYSSTLGGFDDTALREYVANQEVLAFREHFFTVNDRPHLLCVVETQASCVTPSSPEKDHRGDAGAIRDRRDASCSPRNRAARGRRSDPTDGLDEEQRLLFQSVREWRSEAAREEGVPPYVILTNRELRTIVERRPENVTALGHVHGIGPMKVKRHGRAILRLLWPAGIPGDPRRSAPSSLELQDPAMTEPADASEGERLSTSGGVHQAAEATP